MKFGTYILSIFLLVLILFNSTKTSLTYAYYQLDPIGFIENLCENKDKPQMQCNGKCHLMKVAESQNSSQNTPESIIDFKELIYCPNTITNFEFKNELRLKKLNVSVYINHYSFNNINTSFHPPRLFSTYI